jgi:hypothetical protein
MIQAKNFKKEKLLVKNRSNQDQRPWTAVERYKLKGLISRNVPARKIARALVRPLDSITAMADRLGLTID